VNVSFSSWSLRRQCKGDLPTLLLNDAANAPPAHTKDIFLFIG
jgi:hypothetical protein